MLIKLSYFEFSKGKTNISLIRKEIPNKPPFFECDDETTAEEEKELKKFFSGKQNVFSLDQGKQIASSERKKPKTKASPAANIHTIDPKAETLKERRANARKLNLEKKANSKENNTKAVAKKKAIAAKKAVAKKQATK